VQARIVGCSSGPSLRGRAREYMSGLERKNGWTLPVRITWSRLKRLALQAHRSGSLLT
jgi:hypothetical protein